MNSQISPVLGAYLMMGMSMLNDMKTQQEERKEQILAEWRKTKNYPRKKKKRVRKELQLDYSIACWNPLEF
jgi:uncharacterized membrane protein YbaN (DUF454 family)